MKKAFMIWATIIMASVFAVSAFGQDAKSSAKEGGAFTIARLVVATGIEQREPTGIAETFPASTEKVYCFLEAKGIAQDTEVIFVWINNQKEIVKTPMTLKAGSRWRTNVNKSLRGMKGDWSVELRDSAGTVLKDVKFKVE